MAEISVIPLNDEWISMEWSFLGNSYILNVSKMNIVVYRDEILEERIPDKIRVFP